MLQLKRTYRFSLPHLAFPPKRMELSPVPDDDDELMQAIDGDTTDRDNNWTLEERPDANNLTAFWQEVVDDVSKDPKWFQFEGE